MTLIKENIYDFAYYDACPECGGHIDTDEIHSERLCSNCGLVLNERVIDFQKIEKKVFNALDSEVKLTRGDFYNYLKVDITQVNMIRKKEIRDLTKSTTLKRAFKRNNHFNGRETARDAIMRIKIYEIVQVLHLNETIRLRSLYLLKKLLKANPDFRGKNLTYTCATLVYLACRELRYPILIDDFKDYEFTSHKLMLHFKLIRQYLDFKLPLAHPCDYVPRFISELCLDDKEKQSLEFKVRYVLRLIPKEKYIGKRPSCITAEAIYLLSPEVKQEPIAKIARCTEASVSNASRIVREYLPFY
jgi:transcription initiation factor TFIIB